MQLAAGVHDVPPTPQITEQETNNTQSSIMNHKYLLRSAWLIELILLAMPPPACMLLAKASSKALCVTDASVTRQYHKFLESVLQLTI